jgi:hypothetical protein
MRPKVAAAAFGVSLAAVLVLLAVMIWLRQRLRREECGRPTCHHRALACRAASPDGARPLFCTYKSAAAVPAHIWEALDRYAPAAQFDLRFHDDDACVASLRESDPEALRRYHALTVHAHRADLWRYCMLAKHGGVYLDIKTILTRPVAEMFPDPGTLYTCLCVRTRPGDAGSERPVGEGGTPCVYQGILAAPAGHPAILRARRHALDVPVFPSLPYNVFVDEFRRILVEHCGTERLVAGTYAPAGKGRVVLFQEVQTTDCARKDRYGYCKIQAVGADGAAVCTIRDPTFPW